MVKKSINQKIRYNLTIASLLGSFVIIVIGFYYLNGLTDNIKSTKVKIAEIKRDTALIDKIIQEQRQYKEDILKIKSTIPSEYYEVSHFTTELEKIAQNNNLTIDISIDKGKKEEKQSYSSIVYSLEITGGYSSTANFLTQMSKLPYHTIIDNLKTAQDVGGLVTKVKFRLFVEK